MKKAVFFIFCFAVLLAFTAQLSSCTKRDISNPPGVYFYNITGYVSADTILPAGSIAYIYVHANKIGVNDYLASATIARSINGSPDSIISSMKFVERQFNEIYSYQLGAAGNKYKYVFSFSNQNGVSASDSVTITTN